MIKIVAELIEKSASEKLLNVLLPRVDSGLYLVFILSSTYEIRTNTDTVTTYTSTEF